MSSKLWVTPVIVLMLLGGVVSASATVRHIDPDQLKVVGPDPKVLFDLYGSIMSHVASENFTGAGYWISWAQRVVPLPANKDDLDGYVSTLIKESSEVNSTNTVISEAQRLVGLFRSAEALQILSNATSSLDRANRTLNTLGSSSVGLGSLFKISDSSLQSGVSEIRALLASYRQIIGDLKAEVDQNLKLVKTTLSLSSNNTIALVGSSVRLSGELMGGEGALAGRGVNLLVDGVAVAKITTDPVGRFDLVLGIPYIYKSSINVTAIYSPNVNDVGVYAPCSSNDVKIDLIYYTPVISCSLPAEVYPNATICFNGLVLYDGNPLSLPLVVSAFGLNATGVSGVDGRFSGSIMVPSDQPNGEEYVRVNSSSSGVYGPAHALFSFRVKRIPSVLEVSSPSWVISGLKLRIDGKVSSQGQPISECSLDVRGPSSEATLNADGIGSFVVWVDVPFPTTTASYTYSVYANPGAPSVSGSRAVGSVYVINVFTLVVLPAICLALAVNASRGIRLGRVKSPTPSVATPTLSQGAVPDTQVEGSLTIESLFSFVVSRLSSLHGLAMRPSSTIREWLAEVQPVVGAPIYEAIEGIGVAYERFLYGAPSKPDEGYLRQLFNRIRSLFEHEDENGPN